MAASEAVEDKLKSLHKEAVDRILYLKETLVVWEERKAKAEQEYRAIEREIEKVHKKIYELEQLLGIKLL